MNHRADPPRYREIQRWSDVWLVMVVVVAIAAVQWWWFIQQVVIGQTFGLNAVSDWIMLVMWLAFGVGLPLLAYWLRMVVEVYPDRVVIDYRPLRMQTILMLNVVTVEPRVLDPQPAWGGWGVQGEAGNRIYNVSGKTAVQLILRDRSRVFIGTHSADRLAAAIVAARYDI